MVPPLVLDRVPTSELEEELETQYRLMVRLVNDKGKMTSAHGKRKVQTRLDRARRFGEQSS
jgi:hypothetical protein